MPINLPKNELNEFSLPRVCVGTGQQGQVTFRKMTFQFVPKWIAIFAIAPLLYLILMMALRKTAEGTLPFSDEAWERVTRARRGMLVSVLGMIGAMFLGGVLSGSSRDLGPLVIFAGLIGGLIGIIFFSVRTRAVTPLATLITDASVTLKLPSAEAERLIEQHLQAGARRP